MLRLFVLSLLLASGTVNAVELWSGAEAGMTVDQVEAVIPASERTPQYQTARDGTRLELRAVGPVFSEHQFVADFLFHDGSLVAVNLRTEKDLGALEIRPLFTKVKETLLLKYGAPLQLKEEFGEGGADFSAVFRGEGKLVHLYGVSMGGGNGRVLVRYTAPAGTESF